MKVLNEYQEEHKGSLGTYKVTITETTTAYYVTLYRLGYENPCAKNLRFIKRKTRTYKVCIKSAINWYENKCTIG